MSRRTSEASKAVREAWERERQLVLQGEGTRDWTMEQQQSIIDKGKAYDDDGKAFEGHHMKSAEVFPEYQGDAENIQFLTRTEHQGAHGGSFHNPTNGYYDPITCITRGFCENKYEPCEIIRLSEPIANTSVIAIDVTKDNELPLGNDVDAVEPESGTTDWAGTIQPRSVLLKKAVSTPKPSSNIKSSSKADGGIGDKITHVKEAVRKFRNKHPVLTGIGKRVVGVGGVVGLGAVARAFNNSEKSNKRSFSHPSTTDSDKSEDDSNALDSIDNTLPIQRDYLDERSSPCRHEVSGHWQHYGENKELKWVDTYPRGGSKDN